MNRQAARRRVRKRRSPRENSRVKFGVFLGIMGLAVLLGYLTARFVVGPLIGYDADESQIKSISELNEADKQTEKDAEKDAGKAEESKKDAAKSEKSEKATAKAPATAPTEGYALQFGAFSSREAAKELADTLQQQGIKVKIIETDKVFKVISPVMDTREEALASLEKIGEKEVEDVFIAAFGS